MNHFDKDSAMKRRIWMSKILYTAIGACLLGSTMQGAVLWNGILITTNVTNQNIVVSGNNTIATQVLVTANDGGTHTVTASAGNPTQIKSIANPGNLAFAATNSSTIVFNISNTTDFNLTSNNTVTQPFLITLESSDGTGQFIFNIDGGSSITLTGDPTNPALVGTDMFVIMNATQANPLVIIRRDTAGAPQPNVDASINIANNSLFSFLAPTAVSSGTATEHATVQIDASNAIADAGTIELVLTGSSSAFIIDGELTLAASHPTFSQIQLQTPAGLLATVDLINSKSGTGGWSGFQVQDSVSTYGQLLIQNGSCTTNFPTYTGARTGFILGAQGNLTIGNLSYMLFLDGSINGPFVPSTPLACGTDTCCITSLLQLYKDRNPGAFIVDGNLTTTFAGTASITLQGESLLAFASTVNCCGTTILDPSPPNAFTLKTLQNSLDPRGEGAIVFDVEGPLNVTGVVATTGLELLSLNVTLTGGPALISGTSDVFPLRTYATDTNGNYFMYGNASWMVNNILNLFTTNIKWTFYDVTNTSTGVTSNGKRIYPNNQPSQSEPGIISGERQFITSLNQPNINPLCGGVNVIQYFNSNLLLHTSLALNVDQAIPNQNTGNTSSFVFYTNGYCLDEGTGRQLILGTDVGALASDGAHVIYHNSQLNLMQTTLGTASTQLLNWTTGLNNQYVTQGLSSAAITGQTSVHTVNLAHESNISIGTNLSAGTPSFPLTTTPTLDIISNYLNVTSQGGRLFQPGMSMSTGEGGIFVDENGVITVGPNILFAYGAMITKSGNGIVNLPRNQVLPLSTVGIAQWELNLSDPTQVVVVPTGQHIANYTIDWRNTTKKFCAGSGNYIPYTYIITSTAACPVLAGVTPVVAQNIAPLPTVQGRVDQIQMKNSRVGDPSQLIVDGGIVDEALYFNGVMDPSIAPVGTIIVRNDGIVGLGSAQRSIDSLQASVVLGVNGITLLADGNGTVRLNEDVLVNNLCSFLRGPDFGATGLQQLTLDSDVPREIRVKSDGILDLTQFTNLNQRLTFAGQVRLVLEPGATVALGGGSLYFVGNSSLFIEPYINEDLAAGTTLASTDPIRVRFLGSGQVTIQESAIMSVPRGGYIGVEADTCLYNTQTSVQSWRVADSGQLNIGDNETYGGVFQVGNSTAKAGTTVSFTLIIDGQDALVQVNSQGFLGLGMGVGFNQPGVVMNSRLVGKTYNVAAVNIVDTQGTLASQTIFPGTSNLAGLIALGPDPVFSVQFDRNNGEILGGGNIIVVTTTNTGLFNPVVVGNATIPLVSPTSPVPLVVNPATLFSATDNLGQPVTYGANILSSQTILLDASKTSGAAGNPVTVTGTPLQVFLYLAMLEYHMQSRKMVTVAPSELGRDVIGFVYQNPTTNAIEIWRQNATRFLSGGIDVGSQQALVIGTAGAVISGYPPAAQLSILS